MNKVKYFDDKTIEAKAFEMSERLSTAGLIRNRKIVIKNPALMIIDMQDYFLNSSSHAFVPSSSAIISKIQQIASFFINKKLPVLMTMHINDDKNSACLGSWWRDVIKADNSYCNISDMINIDGSIKIKKTQYDAFYNTELDSLLKSLGIETLIITGVLTNCCCETTARSAFVRGYNVVFPIDMTATYHEDLHFSTLLNLAYGFTEPVMSIDLFKALGEID